MLEMAPDLLNRLSSCLIYRLLLETTLVISFLGGIIYYLTTRELDVDRHTWCLMFFFNQEPWHVGQINAISSQFLRKCCSRSVSALNSSLGAQSLGHFSLIRKHLLPCASYSPYFTCYLHFSQPKISCLKISITLRLGLLMVYYCMQ